MAQESAVCVFDITIPCKKFTWNQVKNWMDDNCKSWCFQKEKGEETGYEHYQCRISLKIKKRISTLIKTVPKGFHLSVTSNANKENNFYVLKEETRIDGPWSDQDIYVPKRFSGEIEWMPWQEKVIKKISAPANDRIVNLIYSPTGNQGRSFLTGWLCTHKLAQIIPPTDELAHVMEVALARPNMNCYIIDIPRAIRKEKTAQLFAGIEILKSGYAYDRRFNFKDKWMEPPHVWVFVNSLPNMDDLSPDKWNLWQINNKKKLVPYVTPQINIEEEVSQGASL